MRLYLDVSCLNRPFDDQRQARIRLEAEAVLVILEQVDMGKWQQVSSQIAEIEVTAIRDQERRRRVTALLPAKSDRIELTSAMFARAAELEKFGFKSADALHIAAGESLKVDAILSCDDRLCRLAAKHRSKLEVKVINPLIWLRENFDASNA